jgi:ribosome-binding protein aMBF1 (putative translation factor)
LAWKCEYLAEAITERDTLLVAKEKAALINADAKLEALGPQLPYPHSSAVAGADRLRELRPRGGRSAWRALYRQVGQKFVVAAIAPEARRRSARVRTSLPAGRSASGEVGAEEMTKKQIRSKTASQLAEAEARDPEVAAELARTAVANQLAVLVIQYRVDHDLTQTALARMLGMSQPAVARLEAGDHEPSVATLMRLARYLGLTLRLKLSGDSAELVSA